MKIFPFQAIYPNVDLIASPDSFFATIREDYPEYFQNGFFNISDDPAYYILDIKTTDGLHSGLVAAVHVNDYSKGRIVKHEQTIASSEQEMIKVLLQRGAMVKPVLLCHPRSDEIHQEIKKLKKGKKPLLSVTAEPGENQYSLYLVRKQDGEKLVQLYEALIPKVYIADGHHRCSTGEKLFNLKGGKKGKDYSLLLAALFSFDELDILDYNRVVQLPYHLKHIKFIAEVSRVADIVPLAGRSKPEKKHDLTMCIQEDWFLLTWKDHILKKYKNGPAVLDAFLLDKEILESILGFQDIRTDERVDFIPGNLGAEKVEEKAMATEHHVGFCIYPVQFDELVKVSDAGGSLPPKSTWFEPRLLNGLIVKSF